MILGVFGANALCCTCDEGSCEWSTVSGIEVSVMVGVFDDSGSATCMVVEYDEDGSACDESTLSVETVA